MHTTQPLDDTEKIIAELNAVLVACGDPPLVRSPQAVGGSELQLLQSIRKEYTARLRQKNSLYRLVPANLIPDLFLQALNQREAELKTGTQ